MSRENSCSVPTDGNSCLHPYPKDSHLSAHPALALPAPFLSAHTSDTTSTSLA